MKATITDKMLDAAVRKAVEAGLLPRHACREDASGYQELIRYVLQAAMDADTASQEGGATAISRRRRMHRGFSEVHDVAQWMAGYAQREGSQ